MSRQKVSLITGAGGGIGLAIANALIGRGDKVVLADVSFSQEDVRRKTTEALHAGAPLVTLDITQTESVGRQIDEIVSGFGRLDCLVNAAGMVRVGSFYELQDADWDATIDVNMKGAFILSRSVAGVMIRQRKGRIVHIGSTASQTAAAGGAIYAASKHGLLGLVRGMACDLAQFGVTVNAVCPGNTETEMLEKVLRERAQRQNCSLDEVRDEIIRKTPAGRLGQPRDLAEAVLFLTSDQAEFITGQALTVDGGRSLNLV